MLLALLPVDMLAASPRRDRGSASMPTRRHLAARWLLALIAAGSALAIFSGMISSGSSAADAARSNDFMQHAAFARALCAGMELQPHFLLELLDCAIAAPLGGGAFPWALVVLAVIAVVAKIELTYGRIRESGGTGVAFLAALALLFAMPIFNWWHFPAVYLGQVGPNVWHNPTSVAVLPLAMMLFYAAARLTPSDSPRRVAGASGLAVLNILTKPNYLLALLPVWSFVLLHRTGTVWKNPTLRRRALLVAAGLAGPSVAVLAWQAHTLAGSGGSGGVEIAPLAVWRLYSPNIPASTLLSIAFPLAVLILHWPAASRQAPLRLAWFVLLIAVLQMAFLAERGPRRTHGNLFWGAYAANYLLFVESVVVLAGEPRSRRTICAWALLACHAVSGLAYAWQLVTLKAVV